MTIFNKDDPISKEMMMFPTTTRCGHTFDKLTLLLYMKGKTNIHCPVCSKNILLYGDIIHSSKNYEIASYLEQYIQSVFHNKIFNDTGFETLKEYYDNKEITMKKIDQLCATYEQEYTKSHKLVEWCCYNLNHYLYMLNNGNVNKIMITPSQNTNKILSIIENNFYVAEAITKLCIENKIELLFIRKHIARQSENKMITQYHDISLCKYNTNVRCK